MCRKAGGAHRGDRDVRHDLDRSFAPWHTHEVWRQPLLSRALTLLALVGLLASSGAGCLCHTDSKSGLTHCHADAPVSQLTPSCCCAEGAFVTEISEAVRPAVKLEHPALGTTEAIRGIESAPGSLTELRPTDFGIDRSPPPSFQSPLRI